MSRPVKIFAILLVVVVLGAAVAGIAYWTAGMDPDYVEPGLYIKDKKVSDPGYLLKIGETEVPFDVYRHYFLTYKSYFGMYYGNTYFDDDPDGDKALVLKQAVEAELSNMYAWHAVAAELGVVLDEEDLAEINNTLAEQKAEYGDKFADQLEDMFYTSEANYVEITKMQRLQAKAREVFEEQEKERNKTRWETEADKEFVEDYISAKHILIAFETDAETGEVSDEADAAALERIEEILAEILASEDPEATFDELMWEVSDDAAALESNPDGYTFAEGTMVDEFYEGALALEEGEISEPIRTDYGYHIILRLPLNEEEQASYRESYVITKVSDAVNEKIEAVKETMPLSYGEKYDDFLGDGIR